MTHLRPLPSSVRAQEDLALARRCVAGDRAAQRELFDRQAPRVHSSLFRILGTNNAMDDLMQDTFLEVFRSLATFRGEATLATWIDRCAVRVAYAFLSGKKRRFSPLEFVTEVAAGDPSAEDRVLSREAARRFYKELERIEPVQRLAFALHAVDGRPLEEVAGLTGASLEATKSRVWRAKQALEKRARRDPLLSHFLKAESSGEPREP